MTTNWLFDLNRDGSSEGWEDAAIKNFRGNPLNNLAREIIQNSLDAPKISASAPIKVIFEKVRVPTEQIPNIDELRQTINKCQDAADTFVLPDKQENLKLAHETIWSDEIDLLIIRESGTAGMEGPCVPGKPLYKYMKAKGQGGKSFDGARGSHGQGKAAPILCSQLHTIFVSTNWQTDNLVMGRATLSSHYGENKKSIHNNVGYWGDEFDPVAFNASMPDWLHRKEPGTNIVVIGFKQFASWAEILRAAVAMNFFAALSKKNLSVVIDGYEINEYTLPQVFAEARLSKILEAQSDVPVEDFERGKAYFDALLRPDFFEEGEVLNLGFFNFSIKQREDGLQNIGLLRDDMFITSEVPKLKRKFGASFSGFDMIIEPASSSAKNLVKSMEPPAHDGLNTSWIDDEELRRKTESGLTHLRRRVVELLERHLRLDGGDAEQHSVFDKFFSVSGGGEQISDAMDPTGGFVFSSRQIKETVQSNVMVLSGSWSHQLDGADIEKDKQGASDNTQTPGNPEHGENSPAKPPELGSEASEASLSEFKAKPVQLMNVKMKTLTGSSLLVEFEAEKTGRLKLLIAQQGSDIKSMIMIKNATKGTVTDDGALLIETEAYKKVRAELTLHHVFSGAVALLASGA